ncbi:MAG: MBL fold metallo-hydrolase [Clostridia bacterium]|nr:MBL fold metallo-hydrolase [Clostridia bacterium]
MYELVCARGNSYYIESPAKMGLVALDDGRCVLIDSGGDKDAGKKALKHINAQGWKLEAVFNTHSNADHIGGNRYLQTQTGCRVFAPGIECDFTRHTILEPAFLYGGFPPKELRHKFLMAQECDCEYLSADAVPEGMEIIDLPGHFFDMVGFRTKDGVAYIADCLSSRETIEKYRVGFVYDVGAYLETLEMVKGMEAELFVPAHAPATDNIAELAQYNIDAVHQVAERILQICAEPKCFEQVLKEVFGGFGLKMTFEQYALVGSTVRSYLTWLKDTGRLAAEFEDNVLLWKNV